MAVLRQLVEEDIAKQMGKPIHNRYHNVQVLPFNNLLRYLWTCLVLDFLLVQIVIGPFTVAIWRGAWELYDDIFLVRLLYNLYTVYRWTFPQSLLGEDRMYVGLVCFICGFVVSFVILKSSKSLQNCTF